MGTERLGGGGEVVPMILAAGRATRLRPLSEQRAKAVVPFLNRPLLDYTLDWLARQGFGRVVINLHHGGETIESRYGGRAFGLDVVYSREPRLLGTGGGPRQALDLLGERILLINGDVLTLASLGPLLRHHETSGALVTLGLYAGASAQGYPRVTASADGRLLAFPGEEVSADAGPLVRGVFAGIHLLERRVLELLPPGVPCGTVIPLYRELLRADLPISALRLVGSWYEVGDPARYIDNQLAALARGGFPLARRGTLRFLDGGYVSAHAHLENTRLRAPFLVGSGARIKHGAQVTASVVGDRARVASGAGLHSCVLWPGAWVGAGARLRRCVVMEGVRVPPGTVARETVFAPGGETAFGSGQAGAA